MLSSPTTSLYSLGRGILSVGEWSGATPPSSYTDMGNAPAVSLELTDNVLSHYSSRTGVKEKDEEITLEEGYKVAFSLDEMAFENMRLFLRASVHGNVLRGMTTTVKHHAIRFVAENPIMIGGEQFKVFLFHKAKIKPSGQLQLINDEWVQMGYEAEGLTDRSNHPDSPWFDVTFGTSTTTTTTTTTV